MSLGGLIFISLVLGVVAWLAFVWSVKSGQYEDPEGPKYRMLEDDEEGPSAPPPPSSPPPPPAGPARPGGR